MAKENRPKPKGPAAAAGPAQVADFFETLDHPLKEAMVLIRQVILEARPGVTEHIKWNAPSFCQNGDDRITFNLHKSDRVVLVFHLGAKAKPRVKKGRLIDDPTGLLTWVADDRATVTFATLDEVRAARTKLSAVVQQWLKAAADQKPES